MRHPRRSDRDEVNSTSRSRAVYRDVCRHSAHLLLDLLCGQPLQSAQLRFSLPCGQGVQAAQRLFSLPCGQGLQSAQLSFRLPCGQGLQFVQLPFTLPCGHGLQSAQLRFSLPCGQGLQSAQFCFILPCEHRLRTLIASRGRAPRARARERVSSLSSKDACRGFLTRRLAFRSLREMTRQTAPPFPRRFPAVPSPSRGRSRRAASTRAPPGSAAGESALALGGRPARL
jgi:hypothetical protein